MMTLHQVPTAVIYLLFVHGTYPMEVGEETTVFMTMDINAAFEDKIMTFDIISTQTVRTKSYCSQICLSQYLCLSFFYNKHSQLCQTHSLVFTDPASSLVSSGTSYYYITNGNTILEPIKSCGDPPFMSNVSWGTGTNFIGSKREFTCTDSLLPTAHHMHVECTTTGNWSDFTQYCRDVTLVSCDTVQACSSTNGDATYLLYPPVLGGYGVNIYCHNMATVPEAFVTLFEENKFRNDYSLRVNSTPCQFQDRDGDAYSSFHKIRVNLTDMSVIRDDYTFATTYQEIFHILYGTIPLYGEAHSCSFSYDRQPTLTGNCPAPGTLVINTRGTGLKVDPSLTWQLWGYVPRLESFSRSADGHVIQAAIDGWCGHYTLSRTMFLHADNIDGQKGTASIPICPDL